MNSDDYRTIILEILRVGLIAIRNLSNPPFRIPQRDEKLKQWASLCHSLPALLLGSCDAEGVKYFLKSDAKAFCSGYPASHDADYCQIVGLKTELDAMFPASTP